MAAHNQPGNPNAVIIIHIFNPTHSSDPEWPKNFRPLRGHLLDHVRPGDRWKRQPDSKFSKSISFFTARIAFIMQLSTLFLLYICLHCTFLFKIPLLRNRNLEWFDDLITTGWVLLAQRVTKWYFSMMPSMVFTMSFIWSVIAVLFVFPLELWQLDWALNKHLDVPCLFLRLELL